MKMNWKVSGMLGLRLVEGDRQLAISVTQNGDLDDWTVVAIEASLQREAVFEDHRQSWIADRVGLRDATAKAEQFAEEWLADMEEECLETPEEKEDPQQCPAQVNYLNRRCRNKITHFKVRGRAVCTSHANRIGELKFYDEDEPTQQKDQHETPTD